MMVTVKCTGDRPLRRQWISSMSHLLHGIPKLTPSRRPTAKQMTVCPRMENLARHCGPHFRVWTELAKSWNPKWKHKRIRKTTIPQALLITKSSPFLLYKCKKMDHNQPPMRINTRYRKLIQAQVKTVKRYNKKPFKTLIRPLQTELASELRRRVSTRNTWRRSIRNLWILKTKFCRCLRKTDGLKFHTSKKTSRVGFNSTPFWFTEK